MNDRRAFLKAIAADPDDDTARLAFADWLDENGDSDRAEFIRVQIELEPIRCRADNPRALELHAREDELLLAHRDAWLGFGARFADPADSGPHFRRGFPHSVCWSLDTFASRFGRLRSDHPTVREVTLFGLAHRSDNPALPALLDGIEQLEIADWTTRHDALVLPPLLETIPRLKLWAGGPSWLIDAIVERRNARWPHEIELIQVYGGEACDVDTAAMLDEEADGLAADANRQFGREVVRVVRPFARRFPLGGRVGFNIRAGFLPDGEPAIAAASFTKWALVVFDDRGYVVHADEHDSPYSPPREPGRVNESLRALTAAFDRWVDDKLQLEHGLIRVREFFARGLGVTQWPRHLAERLSDPRPGAPDDADEYVNRGPYWNTWHDRGGDARRWLDDGRFVLHWGREHWGDWRGVTRES